MLIRNAQLLDGRLVDVRVMDGRIAAMGSLDPTPSERVIDAVGGLLLPGLHDHHLHLAATAAARGSVSCGPPDVIDADQLAQALAPPGSDWLRGVGYHESVAGLIDRRWLDQVAPDRPVRVQHRSGRMWFFNSVGLSRLLETGLPMPVGLDRSTGRLFDEDAWMRRALGGQLPSLSALSAEFARLGVTGFTEISPSNGAKAHDWLGGEQREGSLLQRVLLAGSAELAECDYDETLSLGPVKVHLHEANLPPHDELIDRMRGSHRQGRPVAVHCVTEVELVYTLAALEVAGASHADRIEHAAVAPDTLVRQIADMGLNVVTQPHFIFERGDAYRRDIPQDEWPFLYRLSAFVDAGVPIAGSSDAPFGNIDPWAAMAAAVSRQTRNGEALGDAEALTPEQALGLFLADPVNLRRTRTVAIGVNSDLCLLDAPWKQVRGALSKACVRLVMIGGRVVHDRVDQAPA